MTKKENMKNKSTLNKGNLMDKVLGEHFVHVKWGKILKNKKNKIKKKKRGKRIGYGVVHVKC